MAGSANGSTMVSEAVIQSMSGVAGSIIALLATYPLKTIYTLQALSSQESQRSMSILDIVLRYKLFGLYVGLEPNIIESGLSSGVYFYLYSKLRDMAVNHSRRQANPTAAAASSKDQDIGFLASLLVPAIAAVGNQLVTMPASVIATRMQATKKAHMEGKTSRPATMTSIISAVWSESGLGGFWAGLLPSLVLISNPSIQFMLYEQILRGLRAWKRRRMVQQQQQQPAGNSLNPSSSTSKASTAGGASDADAAQPNGVVAVDDSVVSEASNSSGSSGWHSANRSSDRLHTQQQQHASTAHLLPEDAQGSQQSLAADGPGSVQGKAASPAAAAQQVPVRLAAWETFLASALSKIGATLATYWLVVVKSRMQAASKSMPAEQQYKSTWDALMRIWREEGVQGFHKGLPAKLVQTALNAALMLMLKEQVSTAVRQMLTSPDFRRRLARMRQVLVA